MEDTNSGSGSGSGSGSDSGGQAFSSLMRLNIKLDLLRFSSSLSGSQSSCLKSNSLLSPISASKITRAARFCSLDTRLTFSSDAVHHAHEPRGRLRLIFFSTAIRCDTFLQMSSMCSVKLK